MSFIIGGMLGSAVTIVLMSLMVYSKKGDEMNNIDYTYDFRDCDNCIHHADGGCTKWECEYEAADD